MKNPITIAGTVAFLSLSAAAAQTTLPAHTAKHHGTTHRKQVKKPAGPSIETQIQEMRVELQAQINDLKTSLAAKDAQIASLQGAAQATQATATSTAVQVQSLDTNVRANTTVVNGLQTSVSSLQTQTDSVATGVAEVRKSEEVLKKDVYEPLAIHYKGVTITPGGFLAGESIFRQRAMNADLYTNFNATPYMNSGEAHTSEWVPSARQSRLSMLASGKVPFGTVSGYFEGDFLSAGVTSNNLQSNSYTLRVRQAWAQASAGRIKFTGGQMWSLLVENKVSTNPGQEAVPINFDSNLHVGSSYVRQLGFRFQDAFTPKVTLAISLENSQYQFAASNAPSNFFFGNAGAAGGLNNSTANYTNQVAPDVIAKLAFDPKYGHFEIGGVARFFRDRYYPTTTAAGAQNDTRLGGGFVANARFLVTPRATIGLHLLAGDGTGRYGPALLPDITVRPNGTLAPIRNAQGLFSLELHPTKKLDLFGYAGTEYAQRTTHLNAAGVLVGYAPQTQVNTGCFTEALPTAGTGYAPGVSACGGATRVITQGSAGYSYRIYSGPAGRLQYGLAYSYLTRQSWAGIGGAPKATNNFVYTSFRYYLP